MGNKNDVTCFQESIDKLSKKFSIGKLILVGDRGMISQKNIDLLDKSGYEYILGYRMRTISQEDRKKVLSKADLKVIRKKDLAYKEVKYQGKRLLVCYNPERAKKDKEHREEIIERIKEKIDGKSISSVITNPQYKKFLKIHGQNPRIDQSKVKQDELYDGVYVLTTNTELKCNQIIERYKDLWQIEFGFRQLKSELEAGPIYHWKDRRIKAHITICFYALILQTVLRKKMKEKYPDLSYSQAMGELKELNAIGISVQDQRVITRTDLKSNALKVFESIAMRPPNRILSSDPIKNILTM